MFEELLANAYQLVDNLANSDEGEKCTKNLAKMVGNFYHSLVEDQNILEDIAAAIVAQSIQNLRSRK